MNTTAQGNTNASQRNGVASHVDPLRLAAEQEDADAQYDLALAYDDGEGVPQNDALAAEWFARAAEQGHAPAQYNLGVAYVLGRGVLQDDALAAKWWKRAAAQGYAIAKQNLERRMRAFA